MPQLVDPASTNMVAIPSQAQPVQQPQRQPAPAPPRDPFVPAQNSPVAMILPHDDHAAQQTMEGPEKKSRGEPVRFAAQAPPGGLLFRGIQYPAGEFLPEEADPTKPHPRPPVVAAPPAKKSSMRDRFRGALQRSKAKRSGDPVQMARLSTFSGWIDPRGNKYALAEGQHHGQWANQHLGLPEDSYDGFNQLHKSGWIRVTGAGRFSDQQKISTGSLRRESVRNNLISHLGSLHPDEPVSVGADDQGGVINGTASEAAQKLAYHYDPRVHLMQRSEQFSRFIGTTHRLMTPAADGPVLYRSPEDKQIMESHYARIMGRTPDNPTIAALFGWVPGTDLHVYTEMGGQELVGIAGDKETNGNEYRAVRTLRANRRGVPEVHNDSIDIPKYGWFGQPNPYRGLSASLLARQIVAAHEAGVPRITTMAAQDPSRHQPFYIGGLHWPLIGYDGKIEQAEFARIPGHIISAVDQATRGHFSKTRSVFDLVSHPLGVEWWRKNPSQFNGFVETNPKARTRIKVMSSLDESLKKHAAQASQPPETPTAPEQMSRGRGRAMTDAEAETDYRLALDHLVRTGSVHPDHADLLLG